MEKQTIKISRYSDSGSGGFHHVYIVIPNDGIYISNDDGSHITIRAKWDKTRFQMPRIERE